MSPLTIGVLYGGATLVTSDSDFAKLRKQLKVLALPRHSS